VIKAFLAIAASMLHQYVCTTAASRYGPPVVSSKAILAMIQMSMKNSDLALPM